MDPEKTTPQIYSVSEITGDVKSILESAFDSVWIEGEISNLRIPGSQHAYFILKDNRSQIRCVLFKGFRAGLKFQPEDGDQVPRNMEEDVIFNDPTTEDERAEIAAACMLRYNFSFPMLLDKMDNAAEEAYQGWPDRLYLIDADGKINYKGGMGPLYFDVDEFEEKIREQQAKVNTAQS